MSCFVRVFVVVFLYCATTCIDREPLAYSVGLIVSRRVRYLDIDVYTLRPSGKPFMQKPVKVPYGIPNRLMKMSNHTRDLKAIRSSQTGSIRTIIAELYSEANS